MLNSILGVDTDTPRFEDLEEALRAGRGALAFESGQLDFKSELPTDATKFAKAVTAFANRSGGLLVYGIKDVDERAVHWPLVELGEQVTSLNRRLNRGTQPLVPNLRWVPVVSPEDPKRGILLLIVPASSLAPHAVLSGHRMDFYWRQGRESILMNEGDLERAYRDRSLGRARSQEDLERARNWMADSCTGGSIYVLARPSVTGQRIYRGPHDGLDVLSSLVNQSVVRLDGKSIIGPYLRTRIRRIIASKFTASNQAEEEGDVAVLADDGAAAVWQTMPNIDGLTRCNGWERLEPAKVHPNLSCYTSYGMLLRGIVMLLVGIREMYRAFRLTGDIELVFGVRAGGAMLWITNPSEVKGLLDEDVEFDFQVSMDQLHTPKALGRMVGQIHTDIVAGFGFQLQAPVDDDGVFRAKALDSPGHSVDPEFWRKKGLAVE